tara:strand:- start:1305 stop:1676 length:372 start_codon:yes stop_codon:yes gene_type:complete
MKRGLLACLVSMNMGCTFLVDFLGRGYHSRVDLTGDGRIEVVDLFPYDNGTEFTIRGKGINYKSDRFRNLNTDYKLFFDDFNMDGLMDVGFSNERGLYRFYVAYDKEKENFFVYKLPVQEIER